MAERIQKVSMVEESTAPLTPTEKNETKDVVIAGFRSRVDLQVPSSLWGRGGLLNA